MLEAVAYSCRGDNKVCVERVCNLTMLWRQCTVVYPVGWFVGWPVCETQVSKKGDAEMMPVSGTDTPTIGAASGSGDRGMQRRADDRSRQPMCTGTGPPGGAFCRTFYNIVFSKRDDVTRRRLHDQHITSPAVRR